MQHDQVIENGTGAAVRADINNALAAIFGNSSGPSAPSTTIARQLWADETNGLYKRRNAANSGWLPALPGASQMVQSKTGPYTIAPGDYATLIDCSGGFTLGLTAAATLGDGWWCAVKNSGTGQITIDPNASETIDGATTIVLAAGGSAIIWCSGSAFRTVGGFGIPAGVIMPNASLTVPSGWLLCSGGAVSRTTFSALFNAIGTTYGVGDGSTTFNLPDLRGRTVVGLDNMGGVTANRITPGGSGINGTQIGAAGGAETHTLTIGQMPSHSHQAGYATIAAPGSAERSGPSDALFNLASTTAVGGGQAHNNTQPTIILSYIIKA